MSRVDLQDPQHLVDTRRELLEAISSSERIVTQARVGVSQLVEEAARRVAACAETARQLELQRSQSSIEGRDFEGQLGRANAELASAVRVQADIRQRAEELLAMLVRVAVEVRTKGTDGAGFLASYHTKLTGARNAFGTAAAGASTRGAVAPSPSADGDRLKAIAAARDAVKAALASEAHEQGELDPGEAEALRRYTSDRKLKDWDGRWYEIGNALLRGIRHGSAPKSMTLADLERFERAGASTAGLAAALRGLRKLPPMSGDLYRGINTRGWAATQRAEFVKQFVPGTTYRDNGFFSASRQENVARAHAGANGIVLHVVARGARSVEHLSAFGPIEHEALLPPWTDFRVERVRKEASGLTHVWLEEIGP